MMLDHLRIHCLGFLYFHRGDVSYVFFGTFLSDWKVRNLLQMRGSYTQDNIVDFEHIWDFVFAVLGNLCECIEMPWRFLLVHVLVEVANCASLVRSI